MSKCIRVAVLPSDVSDRPLHDHHPRRVIVNFTMGEDGGPAVPMQYRTWSEITITEQEIIEVYESLREHAVIGVLSTGARFAVLRHLR